MTQVTANSNTYSDDGTSTRDMRNGGHRTWFFSLLSDVLADLLGKQNAAASSATAAANSASSAINAPGTNASSTTSLTIATGNQSFVMTTGKAFTAGQQVRIASTATPTNWMDGTLTAYNSSSGAATVSVSNTNGSGTVASWTIALTGAQGARGVDAITSGPIPRSANTMLAAADKGKSFSLSGTYTQTFDTCANLGNGWSCWLANFGTGNVTLTPGGADQIDGMTGYIMYPNEVRLIQCDGTKLTSTILQACKFSSQVSGTWTKPPGYNYFDMMLLAAGGGGAGGGGGGAGSGSTAQGGAGGGGGSGSSGVAGSAALARFAAARLPATISYIIGTGGLGGNGGNGAAGAPSGGSTATAATAGAAGAVGGASTLGSPGTAYYLTTTAGVGGATTTNQGGSVNGGSGSTGGNGGSAGVGPSSTVSALTISTAGVITPAVPNGGTGTAGGNGANAATTPVAGAAGGTGGTAAQSYLFAAQAAGAPGAATAAVAGAAGNNAIALAKAQPGQGGAGGSGGSGSAGCGTTTNAASGPGGNGAKGQDGGDGLLEITGIL